MEKVTISLGSNIEPEKHLRFAIDTLSKTFASLETSPIYRSASQGFEGPDFLNLVVAFESEKTPGEISDYLRKLEEESGRLRNGVKFGNRCLDLDLLTYGELVGDFDGLQLPRDEITKYAFVLRPLSDICPNEPHPHLGVSYAELWNAFPAKEEQALTPINGCLHSNLESS